MTTTSTSMISVAHGVVPLRPGASHQFQGVSGMTRGIRTAHTRGPVSKLEPNWTEIDTQMGHSLASSVEGSRNSKSGELDVMAEGYCVRCKAKQPIAEAVEEVMKNGRKAVKGKCPVCGVVMFKILGGKAAPSASSPAPTSPEPPNP